MDIESFEFLPALVSEIYFLTPSPHLVLEIYPCDFFDESVGFHYY